MDDDPKGNVEYVSANIGDDSVYADSVELMVQVIVTPVSTLRQFVPDTLDVNVVKLFDVVLHGPSEQNILLYSAFIVAQF